GAIPLPGPAVLAPSSPRAAGPSRRARPVSAPSRRAGSGGGSSRRAAHRAATGASVPSRLPRVLVREHRGGVEDRFEVHLLDLPSNSPSRARGPSPEPSVDHGTDSSTASGLRRPPREPECALPRRAARVSAALLGPATTLVECEGRVDGAGQAL